MKIAFITQPWDVVYPADSGGGSSIPMLTYQLARRLIRENEVVIFSKHIEPLPLTETDAEGIVHRRINLDIESRIMKLLNLLDRFTVFGRIKKPFFASQIYFPLYIRQVGQYLARWNPDIVHVHNFSQFVPIIRRYAPDARIIIHMHCEWLSQLDTEMIEKRLIRADAIVGCSRYITEKVKKKFHFIADRCFTIYNGADLSQFVRSSELKSKNNHFRLLFVGRISPEKGVHILLEAFSDVLKLYSNTELKIVGGPGSAPVQFMAGVSDDKRVRDLKRFYSGILSKNDYYYKLMQKWLVKNEMDHVVFTGGIQYSKIQDVYQDADIFINASLTEAFPLPILEAMSMGIPVIASKVGGIPEIVDHEETGLLVSVDNKDDLSDAIIKLLKSKDLRRTMSNNSKQKIKGLHSWDRISREFSDLYKSLLN